MNSLAKVFKIYYELAKNAMYNLPIGGCKASLWAVPNHDTLPHLDTVQILQL